MWNMSLVFVPSFQRRASNLLPFPGLKLELVSQCLFASRRETCHTKIKSQLEASNLSAHPHRKGANRSIRQQSTVPEGKVTKNSSPKYLEGFLVSKHILRCWKQLNFTERDLCTWGSSRHPVQILTHVFFTRLFMIDHHAYKMSLCLLWTVLAGVLPEERPEVSLPAKLRVVCGLMLKGGYLNLGWNQFFKLSNLLNPVSIRTDAQLYLAMDGTVRSPSFGYRCVEFEDKKSGFLFSVWLRLCYVLNTEHNIWIV